LLRIFYFPEPRVGGLYPFLFWSTTLPLLIVFDKKPVFKIAPFFSLDELYTEGADNVRYELPHQSDWTEIFNRFNDFFKLAETFS